MSVYIIRYRFDGHVRELMVGASVTRDAFATAIESVQPYIVSVSRDTWRSE